MVKSTLMARKWTREWGQRRSSTAISRMVRQPATNCPKVARQQHHLCSWGYSHQSDTELLPTHGPSPSWCGSLLWLNVLFAGNWGWRHRETFYLPCHEPALVTGWQGHTCSFLLVNFVRPEQQIYAMNDTSVRKTQNEPTPGLYVWAMGHVISAYLNVARLWR